MIICFVTIDSLSEGIGKSQIVSLVSALNKPYNKIIVVSIEKQPDENLQELLKEEKIDWIRIKFGKKGMLGSFWRLLKLISIIPEADVYHARSDIPALALILARKHPFIWDVRSIWMEQRSVISGNRAQYKLLKKIWVLIEKWIAKRASAMNTLSESVQPILIKRLGTIPEYKSVIPTSVNLDLFKFDPQFPESKRVLLSGTWSNFYDRKLTCSLIDAMESANFEFLWCRPRESHTNFEFKSKVEIIEARYEEMPRHISNSSVGIAICRTDAGISLKAAVPTKIAEFLAVGRPVILSRGMGDLDQLITKYKVGVIMDEETPMDGLIREIQGLLEDEGTPFRCRSVAVENFNLKEGADRYMSLYNKIKFKDS